MLHVLALVAVTAAQPLVQPAAQASTQPPAQPIVSTEWLQAQLADPRLRVVYVGDRDDYDRAHIPGARLIDHMDTVGDNHRLLPSDALARALAKAGAADDTHVVLYGDSPMATGWIYMAIASIGHAGDVSMLDGGILLWQAEKRPTSTAAPAEGRGPLTPRPAPDVIVDAAWVKSRLDSPSVRVLDVRTTSEWKSGHLPGATLILWQDLLADQRTLKFKSLDEMRAVLARAGVTPNQEVVTYCAVGMRASLMYWAARATGVPARVYVGSWQDWQRNSENPIVR
jgi:thiosulfate/3-mercaptopyruvate sulfurtransferase